MKKLKTLINNETISMTKTQKANHFLNVAHLCLTELPDFEEINLEEISSVMTQFESMIRYFKSYEKESLIKKKDEIDTELSIITNKNQILLEEVSAKQKMLNIEKVAYEENKEFLTVLETIEKIQIKLPGVSDNFEIIKNKILFLKEIGEKYEIMRNDIFDCNDLAEKIEARLKEILKDKQEVETILRGKINEI